MAKIENNIIVRGISGMLGKQVVVRRTRKGGYVMSAAPRHSTALSEAQRAQRERFRQGAIYAKAAQHLPEYVQVAEARNQSAYNAAMADFLSQPEVQRIELGDYRGQPGVDIAITAIDDVKVKAVRVTITTDDGGLVETGAAVVSAGSNQWLYRTTATANSSGLRIVAQATDIAGHSAELAAHT
jgi:hypothetical protein